MVRGGKSVQKKTTRMGTQGILVGGQKGDRVVLGLKDVGLHKGVGGEHLDGSGKKRNGRKE